MNQFKENNTFLHLPENARARSLLKSMGYDSQDLKRPRIGVANTWGETSPGHVHLRGVADAVKAGIWQAGGTPFEFNSAAQCPMAVGEHGMRYDLPTRDIIAAEVEAITHISMFDALVMVSSCDKNVPAHLLAAARLDIPVIFVPGGPMDSGHYHGKDSVTTTLDSECYAFGIGNPKISVEEIEEMENRVCPGAGSCALLGTANTMQGLVEALGLALPGAGTAAATSARRLWLAKESGRRIVDLVGKGITSSRIISKQAVANAIKVLHAIGGSTNAIVHLLALVYELHWEKEIDLALFERFSDEVPCITNVVPNGVYTMKDFDEAGGIQTVMKRIEAMLNREALTVTGYTVGENLANAYPAEVSDVIRPLERPIARESLVILRGNLARSAVVRTPVIPREMFQHRGPARVFDSQEEALTALREHKIQPGDVLVLRYEGPKGGPGFNEVFKVIGFLNASGLETKCALVTDGRISGFAKGPYICQVSPEAAEGGPLAVIEDGDQIEIDIPGRRIDLALPEEEIKRRTAAWKRPTPRVHDGFLTAYAKLANPAELGGGLNLRLP
ncbi:MAG: dihydroxy-acid dehydratase [Spirochaetales bacterium]|nr:dihydroxy-acid dehydratase [Spirochaetales bacterium]